MKAATWIATLGLVIGASAVANAGTITCFDPNVVDHGYSIELSEQNDSAVIKQQTMAGTQTLATLPCVSLATNPLQIAPGEAVIRCRPTDVVDTSYVVTITSRDCSGEVKAKLEAQSFAGPTLVGEYVCKE